VPEKLPIFCNCFELWADSNFVVDEAALGHWFIWVPRYSATSIIQRCSAFFRPFVLLLTGDRHQMAAVVKRNTCSVIPSKKSQNRLNSLNMISLHKN